MLRLRPITIGFFAMAALVLGGLTFLVLRPKTPARTSAVPLDESQTALDHRVPVLAPMVPNTAQASSDAMASDQAQLRQRIMSKVASQQQVMRDADERVFQTVNLPDEKREAIRGINERARKEVMAKVLSMPLAPTAEGEVTAILAVTNQADNSRRMAIAALFDVATAKQFRSAERDAARDLRPLSR